MQARVNELLKSYFIALFRYFAMGFILQFVVGVAIIFGSKSLPHNSIINGLSLFVGVIFVIWLPFYQFYFSLKALKKNSFLEKLLYGIFLSTIIWAIFVLRGESKASPWLLLFVVYIMNGIVLAFVWQEERGKKFQQKQDGLESKVIQTQPTQLDLR